MLLAGAAEVLSLLVQKQHRTVVVMAQRLAGRTALITGSTSNIGRAIALAFAAEGAHVAVSGRDEARGAAVAAGIRNTGGTADLVRADLDGSPAAGHALAAAATSQLSGHLDILVNNAGICPTRPEQPAQGRNASC
jgi:NAD(P)-dependent dehydrogenase (short-subunit alcohol dehydrogenase family)